MSLLDARDVLPLMPHRDWRDDARCKGRSDLFFDPVGETPTRRRRREKIAAAMCEACPVRVECMWSARLEHEHGYWGGETEEDRTRAGYMPKSSGRRSVLAARRETRQAS